MSFSKHQKAELMRRAWELRCRGRKYIQIADELGISTSYVGMLVTTAAEQAKAETRENVETHILGAQDRLNGMMDALWDRVEAGDAKAIAVALSIEERRAKLLGLDAVQRSAVDVTSDGKPVSFNVVIPRVDRISQDDE
jgi:orotate phosphoribosyltransferase-like protein